MIAAGLTWIGPSPQAIRDLGDKVTARHIATRAGAPLVPGTAEPVQDADEIIQFAYTYGLPIAIKAAFGGGGRGLKVARSIEEIPELFASATREAIASFGRGEVLRRALPSTSRATSRRRCSPTITAMSSWSAPATARCSAGTRSWSKRRRRRS